MKKYIVHTTTGQFEIEALNIKDAAKAGRFNCRMTKTKYESVRLKK